MLGVIKIKIVLAPACMLILIIDAAKQNTDLPAQDSLVFKQQTSSGNFGDPAKRNATSIDQLLMYSCLKRIGISDGTLFNAYQFET